MEHKDGDINDVVNQMLQDRRENPKGRIDRQKYVDRGHPPNEVRKAAEDVAKIWPVIVKHGNFLECQECQETKEKLRASYGSLEERVQEQEKRVQEHEEGKPEREELERQLREKERKLQDNAEELERLRNEVEQARRANLGQMQKNLNEQEKEIKRLKEEAAESSKSTAKLRGQLADKDWYIEILELEKNQHVQEINRIFDESTKSIRHAKVISRKIVTMETALLGILLVLLFRGHALYVNAIGIIRAGVSFTAMIIHGIYAVPSSLKLIGIRALHYVELHIGLLDQSLVSFLRPFVLFFMIILLILLIASVSSKR